MEEGSYTAHKCSQQAIDQVVKILNKYFLKGHFITLAILSFGNL